MTRNLEIDSLFNGESAERTQRPQDSLILIDGICVNLTLIGSVPDQQRSLNGPALHSSDGEIGPILISHLLPLKFRCFQVVSHPHIPAEAFPNFPARVEAAIASPCQEKFAGVES